MAVSTLTITSMSMPILKLVQCHMSNLGNDPWHVDIIFPLAIGSMSLVGFKKQPCGPVEFKGQTP